MIICSLPYLVSIFAGISLQSLSWPHLWYCLSYSLFSVFHQSIYTRDIIYLPTYLYVCVHTYICIYMCIFFLCAHYHLLISCYNNAWNTLGTQIYVILPIVNSNRLPGLSSGNLPQCYHTSWRYVRDSKESQWFSSFPMRLRAPTLGNDILINYMLSSKVWN